MAKLAILTQMAYGQLLINMVRMGVYQKQSKKNSVLVTALSLKSAMINTVLQQS